MNKYLSKFKASFSKWIKKPFHKAIFIFFFILLTLFTSMYGVAQWYIYSQNNKPTTLGVSFIPDYAKYLGLDPKETYQALLGLNIKEFRLTSYWSDIENTKGTYDFSTLDWEFNLAKQANAKIILTVGLRQPRWPECHIPSWATNEDKSVWQPQLMNLITSVVNRYKDYSNLVSFQVENEYFLKGFGTCTDFSRDRLVQEYNLVKSLDPNHSIILARSNNAIGMPIGQPKGDEYSISIYKRVWDKTITHRYFEYPFPAWFYGFLAGIQEIFLGKNMIVGELQAEAWPPNGQSIPETSLAEQNKSLDASRLKDRFNYGKATGMKNIILWGGEYWYYREKILNDPSLWNVAKEEYK